MAIGHQAGYLFCYFSTSPIGIFGFLGVGLFWAYLARKGGVGKCLGILLNSSFRTKNPTHSDSGSVPPPPTPKNKTKYV